MVWPNVDDFTDGVDKLDAETLNRRLQQLVARTEQLKTVLDSQASRTNVAIAAELQGETSGSTTVYPQLGQPVYRVAGGNAYAKAAAIVGDVEESKWFWADQQAMAVGVVGSAPSGGSATVVLNGYISFGEGIAAADVIADPDPASGRYFLSTTAGKLTAAPVGPIVYVCDCEIRGGRVMSMLVNPQYRDTGESHVHRAFVLSGRPAGGYSAKVGDRYWAQGIARDGASLSATALPTGMTVIPYGYWATDARVTYTLQVVRKSTAAESSTDWGDYLLKWASGGADGSKDDVAISFADGLSPLIFVGSHGLSVQLAISSGTTPASLVGSSVTWTVAMPDAGRAWLNYGTTGFLLNLGMYLEMARFVPPLPANGAELTVGGVELRGPEFGDRRQWEIKPADTDGGPWLVWYGGEVSASSVTAPFEWNATLTDQRARDIVLHVNRMRVGPTGFVTSLQVAPGSPLKVTSAQTGANAAQGALQVGLDIDFKSAAGNAEGHEVVKRIKGATFVTGPVVERVVAGPGMAVDRQQGTVTVSASNAVYAGDFETIALRNAKQDLAGGVFPYTKLLPWVVGGTNIKSGFTAKFRVPDFIPYKKYHVVVSASVFGEAVAASASAAAFTLGCYALADQACAADAPTSGSPGFSGSIASPAGGYEADVAVPFEAGHAAFDPVLVHGFNDGEHGGPGTLVLADTVQRVRNGALWLQTAAETRLEVYPGYFVGISVERCALESGTPYTPAIGFLSLRWNLVAVA